MTLSKINEKPALLAATIATALLVVLQVRRIGVELGPLAFVSVVVLCAVCYLAGLSKGKDKPVKTLTVPAVQQAAPEAPGGASPDQVQALIAERDQAIAQRDSLVAELESERAVIEAYVNQAADKRDF